MSLEKIVGFDRVKDWAESKGWITEQEVSDLVSIKSLDIENGSFTESSSTTRTVTLNGQYDEILPTVSFTHTSGGDTSNDGSRITDTTTGTSETNSFSVRCDSRSSGSQQVNWYVLGITYN